MLIDAVAAVVAGSAAAALCCALALSAYRRTGEPLSPWTLFLGMAVLDVFVPGVMFFVATPSPLPSWITPLTADAVSRSIAVFALSVGLFVAGFAVGMGPSGHVRAAGRLSVVFRPRRAAFVLALSLGLYALYLAHATWQAGSPGAYWMDRLGRRFRPVPMEASSGWLVLLLQLGVSILPVVFVVIGTYFVRRSRSPIVRGVLLPLLGLGLALTTLFRGVVLTYFIGLAILEAGRFKEANDPRQATTPARKRNALRRRTTLALATGLVAFTMYGVVRNYFTLAAWGGATDLSTAVRFELSRVSRGEGLLGLSSILASYPERVPLLGGRTLIDMMLLPVPRSLWHGKPSWYGITDITSAMGWPISTQNAVTMPGELYANFGYLGLCFMVVYGFLFGAAYRMRRAPRFRYVYAFLVVPAMFPTFWMGFTGFVNNLLLAPVAMLALRFVLPPSPARTAAGGRG